MKYLKKFNESLENLNNDNCIEFSIFCLNKAKSYMGHDSPTEIDNTINILNNDPEIILKNEKDKFNCAKLSLQYAKNIGFDENETRQNGSEPYPTSGDHEVDWVIYELDEDFDSLFKEFLSE